MSCPPGTCAQELQVERLRRQMETTGTWRREMGERVEALARNQEAAAVHLDRLGGLVARQGLQAEAQDEALARLQALVTRLEGWAEGVQTGARIHPASSAPRLEVGWGRLRARAKGAGAILVLALSLTVAVGLWALAKLYWGR